MISTFTWFLLSPNGRSSRQEFWLGYFGLIAVLGFLVGTLPNLLGDDFDTGQCLQRAQGHVAEMADRGRHQVEAGNRFRGIEDVAANQKCSVGRNPARCLTRSWKWVLRA